MVLATVAGISQIDRHQMERWGDYWRFTSLTQYAVPNYERRVRDPRGFEMRPAP